MVSLNMEKIQSDPTEQVLNLTLEIILLLTGEEYFVVKKPRGRPTKKSFRETWKARTGGHIPLTQSVLHEPNNKQKILHLTNKMIELLTGEVPLRYEDITVSFSMEEWKYIEEHKDLYKDVLMDDHQPLKSPGLPKRSSSEDPPTQIKEEQNGENVTNPNIYTPTDHIEENPPPIKEEPVSSDGRNLKEPTQQYPFMHIKEEPDSCDSEVLTNPNNCAGQYPCTSIKEEPHSYDDGALTDTNHNAGQYLCTSIKEEPHSYDDGVLTDTNNYAGQYPCTSFKEEPDSCDNGALTDTNNYAGQYLCTSIKEEPHSYDNGALTDTNNYAEQYPCTSIKEEPSSCDGDKKNTPLNHTRQYLLSHIKNEQDGETVTNPNIYVIEDYTQHCPSPQVNEEPFPCSGENIDNTQSLSTHNKEGADVPKTNPPETQCRTNDLNVQFSCSECKKCFLSMAELVSHHGIHIAEKLLQSRTHIVTTTFVHVPQVAPVKYKLLTCSTCGRTFYTKSSLVRHMKTHWGKVNKCGKCGK